MLSVWEKQSFLNYDFAIVGSGIVGLNCALSLSKKYPKSKIVIFERGILPTGASTKNAGFACMGSPTELLSDLKIMNENEVLELFELRKRGLGRTRNLLGDKTIDYMENGSYELLTKDDEYALDKIDYLNKLLYPVLNSNAYTIDNSIIAKNKFNQKIITSAVKNNFEGELNTGKLIGALLDLCFENKIEIKTGVQVKSIEEANNEVLIHVENNITKTFIEFKAKNIFICTNAFTNSLIPNLDISPGRGQVLITKPINNLAFKGIYHLHEGYYYFRELNGCVLFGGGRNLDFEKETTTHFEANKEILDDLILKLETIILPNIAFELDYTWTGIMAFGKNKKPIVQKYGNRVYLCVRMNGMGVAIGSELAHLAVSMLET